MNKVKVLLVGATVLGAFVANQAAHADDFSHFSVTNHQPQAGTFQVNVQGKQRVISHVDFAIWSEENGQDDLKWHTVRNTGSNQVSYSFKAATYANKAGNYVIHAYTTYQGNGGRHGHVVGTREITVSAPQISQTAQGLSLTNRIVPTSPAYLTTAVWSDEGGQDDIRWYTTPASGSVYVPFSNHKGYGTYHVHTYQNKNGQMTGIGVQTITRGQAASSPQTSQPQPSQPTQPVSIQVNKSTELVYEAVIANVPSHISKVSVPTWSTVNGQDDIKWYQATKVGANTYSAKIPLTNHGFDFGTYSAHVYGTNSQTGQSQSLTGTDFQVSDIQGLENPQVTLSNSQSSQGTFTVSVLETALAKKVTGLTVTASQTTNPALTKSYSYKPYTYGRISGQVDLKQISNQTADYSVTALVTYSDQTSTTFTLTNQAYRPVLADTTVVPTPPSTTAPAPKITTYINETNTYPVGQCTWGVKVLAPWIPNWLGNARDWTANAAAKGFRTGTTPAVGAVAVWPNDGGGYGHVAYVTAVESSTRIQVKESNYAGNMTINNYRGWFNPATGPVYYIYPN